MAELSTRARNYLAKQERNWSTIDRDEIISSFVANEAPIFEPLIEFQQKYSGYHFMAGLVPLYLGILQGDGGYPNRTCAAIIEFDSSDNGIFQYQFVCATSECAIKYSLDENGRFYESTNIIASSFDAVVERWALEEEINANRHLRMFMRQQKINVPDIAKKLNLEKIEAASDEYVLWFENDTTYMTQSDGLTTIITLENLDKITALITT